MNNITAADSFKIENFIKEAGEYLLSFYDSKLKVVSQEQRDIKLKADQELEKKIKDFLHEEFEFPVLGEEFSDDEDFSNLTGFVIDPIDGTMNFFRKNPVFCISVGFLVEGKPTYGLIYNPKLNEIIRGGVDLPATFNGELISKELVSKNQAILATGIPTHLNIDKQEDFLSYFSIIKNFKKVRMIGSAAQSVSWIALHRVDAYMEHTIMLWDVCAGLAIVESIGGVYTLEPSSERKWAYNVKAAINSDIFELL